jgi:uncharacterized membrane protein
MGKWVNGHYVKDEEDKKYDRKVFIRLLFLIFVLVVIFLVSLFGALEYYNGSNEKANEIGLGFAVVGLIISGVPLFMLFPGTNAREYR